MIKVENLTKVYDADYCAIDNVSFSLPGKGMVCITGESGSGKTTLLNCLCGAEKYEGKIYIDGKLITKQNADAIKKQYISMVYQDFGLIDDMTVEANLRLAFESVGEKFTEDKLSEILLKLGLEQRLLYIKCRELSGGEKQRVAIARSLAQNASVILADEPTGSLDTENSKAIFELLKTLSEEMLVVVVTHSEKFANDYADYRIELCDGKISETNLPEVGNSSSDRKLKKRRSALSAKSFFDVFKWSFTSKTVVILLSVLSVVLLTASMVLSSLIVVDRNDVVVKNMKYNDEHTVSFMVGGGNQIDKDIFADVKNICYGYQVTGLSFNGTIGEDYDKNDVPYIFSMLPNVQKVVECEDISKIGGKILYGRDPQESDEIAINQYVAKWMINNNQLYDGEKKTKEEDLLGVKVSGVEIVGIIDTGLEKKIELAQLENVEQKKKNEVLEDEDKDRILALFNLISLDFDAGYATVGRGFAEERGLEGNCNAVFLSSKTKNIGKYLDGFSEESYVKVESRYTYGMDNVMEFFETNRQMFFKLTIAIAFCAIAFIVAVTFIVLKGITGKILILRSIGYDKSKVFCPVIIAQLSILVIQLAMSLCVSLAVLAAINFKIRSTLIVPFTVLFGNWSYVGIAAACSAFVLFVFASIYLLLLFTKTVKYQMRKN